MRIGLFSTGDPIGWILLRWICWFLNSIDFSWLMGKSITCPLLLYYFNKTWRNKISKIEFIYFPIEIY